jgi:hypothetical protein
MIASSECSTIAANARRCPCARLSARCRLRTRFATTTLTTVTAVVAAR